MIRATVLFACAIGKYNYHTTLWAELILLPQATSTLKNTTPTEFRWRRLTRLAGRIVVLLLSLSIVMVLILRFVPVPFSGVMIERQWQDWFDDTPDFRMHYHWVPIEQIAKPMQLAVMAGEDQRFPEHYGFDFEQMEKAWQAHQRGKKLRGASTISQQVAKNLFLWSGRSYVRKGLELWFTALIELLWSKERILEVHLNIVEYGRGIYGVDAASIIYFHRPAARLTTPQAALMAAVLPNPHRYKVNKPSAFVLRRQAWIEQQMSDLGGTAFLQQLR